MNAPVNAAHRDPGFFTESLASRDAELFGAMTQELGRQRDEIELIASENIVSRAVMEAQGSVLTNKYAEGYPGGAITAAANLWISQKIWQLTAPSSFSAVILPMCNPIPARRPIRGCFRP